MMSQNPPFGQARPDDPYFKLLNAGSDRFWQMHGRNRPAGFYSEDFKDLIRKMLALDPAERLSYADILAHPWYNGPTVSKEEVMQEIANRRQRHEAEAKAAAEARASGGTVHGHGHVYRGEIEEGKEEEARELK